MNTTPEPTATDTAAAYPVRQRDVMIALGIITNAVAVTTTVTTHQTGLGAATFGLTLALFLRAATCTDRHTPSRQSSAS